MLSGEGILCFTLRPWHSTWKTDQKMMAHLAASNRVLYINPPRAFRTALRDAVHPRRLRPVVEEVADGLFVYQEPVYLPAWGRAHPLSGAYNRVVEPLRLSHIRRTARRLGIEAPILWGCTPFMAGAIGAFGEQLVVYHLLDHFGGYFAPHEIWARRVAAAHAEMLRRADVVFAVSEPLLEESLRVNPHSYLLPNGVQYEPFAAATGAGAPPDDVRAIPRPIVGFVGVLHESVDFELLSALGRAHPEWSLMLVGPVESLSPADTHTFEALRALPNVHYLGRKAPDDLPGYVQACDVGIIPNRINDITAYCDPQKLYEYFACGKPVVSTAVPAVRRFAPLAQVANSREAFVAAVEQVLARPDGQAEARMALARSNSWDRRMEEASAILARHLASGAGRRNGEQPPAGARAGQKAARWQRRAKRALDVIVSAAGLLVLAPLLGAIALAIRVSSPGPVLYRWPVVGKGGRPLRAYKFRTMVVGADDLKQELLDRNEATGPVFKMRNDPRITPVGRLLRKFSLDELPQLWSVLRGELSLVGPRPVLEYEWEQMTPWQRRKLSTTPGIVCLWHLRGQPRSFDEWVKLDLEYVDNWSLWLDLKLIVWTPLYMLSGRNY